jgi:hypothetical protein
LISPGGVHFVCPKCQHRFHVRKKPLPSPPITVTDKQKETPPGYSPKRPASPVGSPSAAKTTIKGLPEAPVSHQRQTIALKVCPHCGLFIRESADQCVHCGSTKVHPPGEPAPLARLPQPSYEEESPPRQNARYLSEILILAVLALVLIVLNRPSGLPSGLRSTPVRDLIRAGSEEEYAQWLNEYRLHIAKRNPAILTDMRTLDREKFSTPYIQRFKKEYLEYDYTTAEYRYSPYTPHQRIIAENPSKYVDIQIHKFEVGQRFIGPVDLSVFNKSAFPLYDIGINLVYEATQGPNRGRKARGFLIIREPVEPGKLNIYTNQHHLQPVMAFEGVDKVSFYVTGVKVGKETK